MMSEITGPVYPLEKAEFIRALATGHGRALIHAERHDTEGVRDGILDASLTSKTYDPQCNGYGEKWLARLCCLAGLVDTIISGRHAFEGGDGALRCRLLKEFALKGDMTALPALREMCRFDAEWNDLLACDEIVELEGEKGFVFVAERLGERLLDDKGFWVTSGLVSLLDEKCGEGAAIAILERESQVNPQIAAYREAVLEDQARKKGYRKQPPPTADEVVEWILRPAKRVLRLIAYGRKATAEDRLKVAALDFTKMESVGLQNYLCYFQDTGFPEFREEHLALLEDTEERNRWRAAAVLSHHSDPALRKAAYETLSRGEAAFFIRLLRSSGLAEDTEPLLEAISVPAILDNDDECHEIGSRLLDLVKTNPAMSDTRLPAWCYQHNPCRHCRRESVELMAERSILPEWMAEECLSDADEDIREIAAKYAGVPKRF